MPFHVFDPDYESQALDQIKDCLSPEGVLWPVTYYVTLPVLLDSPDEPLPCHEPVNETTAISAHVSARVHGFYKQLAAFYATNPKAPGGVNLSLCMRRQGFNGEGPFCRHRRYHSRRLRLHDPSTLLDLPFVSSLTVESQPGYGSGWESEDVRPLSLLVPLQCLVKLPQVEELTLPWMWERPMPCCMPSRVMREHYTRPWEGPLRDARHEFGAAIIDPEKYLCGHRLPASLTKAVLHFWSPQPTAYEDQNLPRPNLIYPAYKDPISIGLCKLATQLHILDLRALITEDLFPHSELKEEQWLKMRRLRIEFHPLRPDGRWYFVGPRGEDPHDSEEGGFKVSAEHYPREHDTKEDEELDEEWEDDPRGGKDYDFESDLFRIEPCRERIEPVLMAFAKALTCDNMPNLEVAEIFTYVWWHPSHSRAAEYGIGPEEGIDTKVHRWGVKYVAGRGERGNDSAAPTVQWQVGDWRPSQDVMSIFGRLGQQEWLDLEFGYRRDFIVSSKSSLF